MSTLISGSPMCVDKVWYAFHEKCSVYRDCAKFMGLCTCVLAWHAWCNNFNNFRKVNKKIRNAGNWIMIFSHLSHFWKVLLIWILGSLLILAHCSDETGARTLQDVLEGVCGRPGLIVCSIAVALYCFGTCITFLIIIGDQYDRGNDNHLTLLYQISSKFTCETKKNVNTHI